MNCMVISENTIAIAKGLIIDVVTNSNHKILQVPTKYQHAGDFIADIVISPNCGQLAVITSLSKELLVYELPVTTVPAKSYALPRSASKLRYTADNSKILVADKSGDALLYDVIVDDDKGIKILGHLSLLLDILQTSDGKYIITSDRDEKVKVSCYPNTYNIQTYCMGHKEFVNHIELLPHDEKYLLSTSGDGTIRVWDYTNGKLCHTINTDDVDTKQLRDEFIQSMDADGIQVESLPILHFSATKLSDVCSILTASIHSFDKVLIYTLQSQDSKWRHTLLQSIEVHKCPSALSFYKQNLYIYDECDLLIKKYKLTTDIFELESKITVFNDNSNIINQKESSLDAIRMLYKRKFDNVQEYQERKRQRLEKGH